jgi:hypothetical protein
MSVNPSAFTSTRSDVAAAVRVRTKAAPVSSAIFENIPIREKELLWIEGTTKRWDGYTRFAKEPGLMLAWFERNMVGW